jgi:AcrR family transcriptional regulator
MGVVDIAMTVIDERGPNALTLAEIANRAGVATPSLYRHVGGLDELQSLVGVRILEELTEELTAAVLGRSNGDAIVALMHAYRAYAKRFPARYLAMPLDPLHDPTLLAAGTRQLDIVLAVLRAYRITGSAAIHTIRCLRAVTHGFVSLEAAGGFGLPENLDESYTRLIEIFLASLPRSDKR